MRAHTLSCVLSISLLLVAIACGRGDRRIAPEGSYSIDRAQFLDRAVDAMREHGLVPAGTEATARDQLGDIVMDIDLRPGGAFTCRMVAMGEDHDYRGTWRLTGTDIRIEQTHEDDEPVTDLLTGTLKGEMLDLVHDENGFAMPYVLRRNANPTAAPR